MEEDYLKLFVEETSWYNDIVLGSMLPEKWSSALPHFYRGWLRNYIGGTLLYFISGILWCFYIYYLKRNIYVPKDAIPSKKAMLLQIGVAMKAMPWYCALPTISEYMIEHGWTKCYLRISDIGWIPYLYYMIIYLVIVEFGIYWMHRELHDIKPLYKYLHATHHIYNKQNTLSPFAGLAFHPLDGILQAVPHVIALFLIPVHFTTHTALLFIEAIWTARYGWTGCSELFVIQWKMRPRKSNICGISSLCTCLFIVRIIGLYDHDCAIYVNFKLGRCSEGRGLVVLEISRDIYSIFVSYKLSFRCIFHD